MTFGNRLCTFSSILIPPPRLISMTNQLYSGVMNADKIKLGKRGKELQTKKKWLKKKLAGLRRLIINICRRLKRINFPLL